MSPAPRATITIDYAEVEYYLGNVAANLNLSESMLYYGYSAK
jgi:hypothetical protein